MKQKQCIRPYCLVVYKPFGSYIVMGEKKVVDLFLEKSACCMFQDLLKRNRSGFVLSELEGLFFEHGIHTRYARVPFEFSLKRRRKNRGKNVAAKRFNLVKAFSYGGRNVVGKANHKSVVIQR